jgi:hypothetical protein
MKNAQNVYNALEEFGAPLKGVSVNDFCNRNLIYQVGVAPVRIDVIMGLSGLDFDLAWEKRKKSKYADIPINIIGKKELKKSKVLSPRPQDLLDLQKLRKLKS